MGEVPWLTDRALSILASGATLLHLGECCPALLRTDCRSRSEAIQSLFAALISVEMASLPWVLFTFTSEAGASAVGRWLNDSIATRWQCLEPMLADRAWLPVPSPPPFGPAGRSARTPNLPESG